MSNWFGDLESSLIFLDFDNLQRNLRNASTDEVAMFIINLMIVSILFIGIIVFLFCVLFNKQSNISPHAKNILQLAVAVTGTFGIFFFVFDRFTASDSETRDLTLRSCQTVSGNISRLFKNVDDRMCQNISMSLLSDSIEEVASQRVRCAFKNDFNSIIEGVQGNCEQIENAFFEQARGNKANFSISELQISIFEEYQKTFGILNDYSAKISKYGMSQQEVFRKIDSHIENLRKAVHHASMVAANNIRTRLNADEVRDIERWTLYAMLAAALAFGTEIIILFERWIASTALAFRVKAASVMAELSRRRAGVDNLETTIGEHSGGGLATQTGKSDGAENTNNNQG